MIDIFNKYVEDFDLRRKTKQRIKDLNPWFYELEIYKCKVNPGIYPMKRKDLPDTRFLVNRQKNRSNLLIDEIVKRYDFSNAKILDLACNCGYWSSVYLRDYGAASVVGIEGRRRFIDQAHLYYESLGLNDRSHFIEDNVMEVDYLNIIENPFDFILCAGILYHVKSYESLLEKISRVNKHSLVIDTRVDPTNLEFIEPGDLYFNAIRDTRDKRVPTKKGLFAVLKKLGYKVESIIPTFSTIKGVDGVDDYNSGNRICLFCEK